MCGVCLEFSYGNAKSFSGSDADSVASIYCLFPPHKSVNEKNVTSNISTHVWSIKQNLFIKLFAWMVCKSRDESNERT